VAAIWCVTLKSIHKLGLVTPREPFIISKISGPRGVYQSIRYAHAAHSAAEVKEEVYWPGNSGWVCKVEGKQLQVSALT